MTDRLAGRSAIVTGAAAGIGRATAQRLAAEGARVLLADIDADGLADAVDAIGGHVAALVTDVAEEAQLEAMVATCAERFGSVDILVNNAAAVGRDVLGLDRDVLSMTVELWDRTIQVNLRSQMLACRFAVPHMLAAGRGAIVNIASVAGMSGDFVRVAYSAAKAGTIAMTKYIATMYGKEGVRCNAVAPGLVLSPAAERGLAPETIARLTDAHLTPRVGTPEDIAAVVAFLASDDAAFVTGEVLRADGGALSHLPTFAQDVRRRRSS